MTGHPGAALAAAVLLGACAPIPPMRHRLEAGADAYAVFAADSRGSRGDLFAVARGGGAPVQLTWTLPEERVPTLSPDGLVVAFVRQRQDDSTAATLWALNLTNGNERQLPLPTDAGVVRRLGWLDGGTWLVVRADRGLWLVPAPPQRGEPVRVAGADSVRADSATTVWLGDGFASAGPCDGRATLMRDSVPVVVPAGQGVCVTTRDGAVQAVSADGRDPAAWGRDSLAFWVRDELVVRALGPSRPRRVRLERGPGRGRALTLFEGYQGERPDAFSPQNPLGIPGMPVPGATPGR